MDSSLSVRLKQADWSTESLKPKNLSFEVFQRIKEVLDDDKSKLHIFSSAFDEKLLSKVLDHLEIFVKEKPADEKLLFYVKEPCNDGFTLEQTVEILSSLVPIPGSSYKELFTRYKNCFQSLSSKELPCDDSVTVMYSIASDERPIDIFFTAATFTVDYMTTKRSQKKYKIFQNNLLCDDSIKENADSRSTIIQLINEANNIIHSTANQATNLNKHAEKNDSQPAESKKIVSCLQQESSSPIVQKKGGKVNAGCLPTSEMCNKQKFGVHHPSNLITNKT